MHFSVAPFCPFKKQLGDPRRCINTGEKSSFCADSGHFRWWRHILRVDRVLDVLVL